MLQLVGPVGLDGWMWGVIGDAMIDIKVGDEPIVISRVMGPQKINGWNLEMVVFKYWGDFTLP